MERERLANRLRGYDWPKEVLRLAVQQRCDVDRTVSAFDGERKTARARRRAKRRRPADALAWLVACDEPVNSGVCRGCIESQPVEFDRVFGIESPVGFSGHKYRLLDAINKQAE